MPRRALRLSLVTVLTAVGTVLGTFVAVFFTPAGRGLAGRALSERVDRLVRGDIEVGAVGGTLLTGLELDHLVIRDTAGQVLADVPHLEARYRLPELLAGRIVLQRLVLDRPRFHVIKHRDGRMNYEEVLRLGEGSGHGPGTLVRFDHVQITGGSLLLEIPWDPPDSMRTPDAARRALTQERALPGRDIEAGPEGYVRRIRFERLTALFPSLRLGTPDHRPVQFVVDSLATRVSDPAVAITDLNGVVEIDGTTLTFRLARLALPASRFKGEGKVFWPAGPPMYDFDLDGPQVSLADLRWISPDFPDLAGRVSVRARSASVRRTSYALDSLALAGPAGAVDGRVTAIVDERRGLGVDAMALRLRALDLDAVRPYLDTLPFHGRISGSLLGGGFLDSLDVDFDWVFTDARVPGGAVDSVSGAGHLALGGPDGTVLDTLTLRRADLDLRSVRLVAPSVPLRGRVQAAGALAGPWTDVTFDGTLTHQDGARPPSTAVGRVRLDTRTDTTAFDGDVAFDPLALDGIRASFPGLAALGELRGRVGFSGTSERLRLDADLSGELGHVAARGVVGARAAGWRAESLAVAFRDLDLARVTGRGPATSLNGTATLDGVADSGAAPEGSLRLALSESDAGALPIDSAAARIRAAGGLLTFDTLALAWPGGAAGGRGTLAWRAPANGRLDLVANAHDLRPLDSLFKTLTGWQPDTAAETRTLSGAATGGLTLSGALDSLSADATLRVSDLAAGPARVPGAGAVVRWQAGARPAVAATLTVDTAVVGGVGFAGGELRLRGFTDSASWQLGTRVGPVDTVTAGGAWTRAGQRTVVALDSLRGVLTAHTWRLAAPTRVVLTDSGVAVDSLRLAAEDGLGELRLAGAAPGTAAGDLRIHALDLDARDLAGFFGRDTLGLTGMVSADLRMGGTAAAPTLRGTASLADAGAGDFRGPYAQGIVDYAGHRLELNALLWKTGRPVMSAQAHLPVDLALTPVDRRLLPGPLDIRVTADSADLGMLEAFTRNARQLHGWVSADAGVEGTWDAPRLTGYVAIRNGGASFPSLGVRYDEIDGRARLAGDTIALDSLTLRSGGTAAVGGSVRLVALTRPVLDLSVDAHGFRAIDARNYLTLIASGKLRLTGPVFGATLAGRMTADEGVLYFADLVTKQVVDLSDPATVALIDTAFARDATLRPSVENRFVDSLNIANLRVSVGDEFWLRSTEANIRLAGDVTVNKAARNYRLDGTLKADRGTYALKIGFITRPFTVQSGTVQFLGTPDLNAELDIQALHTVRPSDATADIPVVAHITGTTLAPKLALSSPQNPTLSETELVSYLMFGRPSFALDQTTAAGPGSSEQAALQTGLAYLSSALSSEIERALVSDLGVPVDFVEIRPGGAGGSFVSANAGLTTLSAGWRIGNRTFFTFNAGLCPNLGQLSYRSFGASIEQRLNPWVRAQASVEPVRTCQPNVAVDALGATNQYQLGFDLLWDREY